MNKIFKTIGKFFKGIYNIIDKILVTPISKFFYLIYRKVKDNGGSIEKILNKKNSLFFISLALAIVVFFVVDAKVITLVQTEAEIITDQPVNISYNKEAYVIEGLPETVDITLIGRKNDLYLAKQLGDHEVYLDLTQYEEGTHTVKLSLNQTIGALNYKLDPGTITITIKKRVSALKTVSEDLLNQEDLDPKLSVKNVGLAKTEVVVKGSQDTLERVATVKALIDLANEDFTAKGTYNVDNIPLVAYDKSGKVIENVEIVSGTVTATIELDSYSKTVPLVVRPSGNLRVGRAINTITINDKSSQEVVIYGDEAALAGIEAVPITIDVTDQGSQNKTYNVSITKPNGVRYISEQTATITLTFGEEIQKTFEGIGLITRGLGPGLTANALNTEHSTVSVQVKGVEEAVNLVKAEEIRAYADLSNYGVGEHQVEVLVEGVDQRVTYVALQTVTIVIK